MMYVRNNKEFDKRESSLMGASWSLDVGLRYFEGDSKAESCSDVRTTNH
jgi:hypothetical protein